MIMDMIDCHEYLLSTAIAGKDEGNTTTSHSCNPNHHNNPTPTTKVNTSNNNNK